MTEQTIRPGRPGRPVRLELNAQRVTAAFAFYAELFGWTSRPLHVPPWGAIPQIVNGDRVFGNQFMAMGAFAVPRWLTWFSADLDRAAEAIPRLGGDMGRGPHQLGDLGRLIDARDRAGASFGLIALAEDPPGADAPGDPCLAEFWGPAASGRAAFYAEVLGLDLVPTPTGAMLSDRDAPRLFFRDVGFEISPPRWIPYFRTTSTGGDLERARRAGAVVQLPRETIPHLGDLAVLADPAGAFFGIVDPAPA